MTTDSTDPALPWRYLVSQPRDGAVNMAWDQALMARARRTGEAVLRVYAWSRPTLSLGRNQTACGAYDLNRAAELGVDFVRRPTGGRALLHHHEVTYSVTAPDAFDATLRGAYARINALLLDALHALGVPAELAVDPTRLPAPGLSPCFDQPAAGEIMVAGRKLVGSAQWRHEGALLQHGSILLADDQHLIAGLLRTPRRTVTPPAATLTAILGESPSFNRVAEALVSTLRAVAPQATPLTVDAELALDVERTTTEFQNERWTWRR
ncbi:MAG: lipoate--protein ligase family protein [Gemmatimonadaceae bacterium]